MGRRVLAFFLGMLFGIIVFLGAIVGVVYFAATSLTPSDVYPESDKFLGDLANMSLFDIYNEISELYKSKIGKIGDNGLYFTLGEFLETYNIDAKEAFGVELDQDILDIPIFEFIGGDTDGALGQIRVSALFQIVNLVTSTTDEAGNISGFFSDEVIEKMRNFYMSDLLDEEKGIPYVFEDLVFADLLSGVFPSEPTDNALMWALGQTSIGRLANGIAGNILLQFKPDGVFETMGSLKMAELFGDSSRLLNVIFGDSTFSDLIDENGNINPDGMLEGIYLGDLLGLQRNEISDVGGYETLYDNENRTVLEKEVAGDKLYVIVIGDVAYEAKLNCHVQDHNNQHTADCYTFVWYNAASDDINTAPATGIYSAIADITIDDLMSGDSNTLIDIFMDIKLNELLDGQEVSGLLESIGDMTLRELLNDGVDNVYLGTIFSNERKPITNVDSYTTQVIVDNEGNPVVKKDASGNLIKLENDTWYEGKITCGQEEHEHNDACKPVRNEDYVCGLDEHAHDEACYGFVWYTDPSFQTERTGAQGYLCNFKLGEINSINLLVQSMTLNDVFGVEKVPYMLKSLADTPVGKLDTAINNIYLGNFLGYSRKPVEGIDTDNATIVYAPNGDGTPNRQKFVYYLYKNGNDVALSTNGREYYVGRLLCTDDEHQEHTSDCYAFVWYVCGDNSTTHEHNSSCYTTEAEGVMSKLAGETIGNLGNLMNIVQTLTLKDVLGDNVPDMLKSIENTQIGQLSAAIENMYLGDLLGYVRNTVDVSASNAKQVGELYVIDSDGDVALSEDGKTFYEGSLICDDNTHTTNHTAKCYSFVWYDCDTNHSHGDGCTVAEGMMGKLANKKISDLSDLSSTIQEFTLKDVLGDKVPSMLKSIENTKIGELDTAIEDMYLGSFLGYEERLVPDTDDEYAWYKLDCQNSSADHVHDDSCYTPADGLMGRMAGMKISELSADTIKDTVSETTLGEVMEIDDANGLFRELANTKIGDLSSELDALYVGIAMGYHRNEIEESDDFAKLVEDENPYHNQGNAIFTDNANNYYFFDAKRNTYYQAQLYCAKTEEHTFSCYGFTWYKCAHESSDEHDDECVVKGLNAKMSNLRIDELGSEYGMTNIATHLTIGDLIDSGMMSLNASDEYKLDIIFDGCDNPSCNLALYLMASQTAGQSAEEYYKSMHDEDESFRGVWKNMELGSFISSLLGAL